MKRPVVLVLEAERATVERLRAYLAVRGLEVIGAAPALGPLTLPEADLVIVCTGREAPEAGLRLAGRVLAARPGRPVVLLVASGSEALAVAALRLGVSDYVADSSSLEDLGEALDRWLTGRTIPPGLDELVGVSPAISDLRGYLERVARTDSNVLVTGETGTGKELVARLVHQASRRRQHRMLSINCAAIPDSLFESELFGFERGAFTGADVARAGKLELAHRGTAFLDEVGDMSLSAQAKILRAIESHEVYRIGGRAPVPADVRIVAATNQDLDLLMSERRFRSDLFFRLHVARVHLPPLRERKDDLLPLIAHYLPELNARFGRRVEGLTDEAIDLLFAHDWPGNVRELRNLLEAMFIDVDSPRITRADLPARFRERLRETAGLPRSERERLIAALFATNWNKSRAAERLRWSRMTLYRKLAKYGLANDPGGRPAGEAGTVAGGLARDGGGTPGVTAPAPGLSHPA
jgi:DNA-binding NtrC family response regulator